MIRLPINACSLCYSISEWISLCLKIIRSYCFHKSTALWKLFWLHLGRLIDLWYLASLWQSLFQISCYRIRYLIWAFFWNLHLIFSEKFCPGYWTSTQERYFWSSFQTKSWFYLASYSHPPFIYHLNLTRFQSLIMVIRSFQSSSHGDQFDLYSGSAT